MSTTIATTTEAVLNQHVQALISRDPDRIASDYADDAVLFTPGGVFKGTEGVRQFVDVALQILSPESLANLKVLKQTIEGEYAYVLWSAGEAIPFAGDTFLIRDGKIVMQSAVFQPAS